MKHTKSVHRSRLTDEQLSSILKIEAEKFKSNCFLLKTKHNPRFHIWKKIVILVIFIILHIINILIFLIIIMKLFGIVIKRVFIN